jgi:cytochrome bd ubiquinol oxidase subunit II
VRSSGASPYVIPPDITIYSAAAPDATLRALMVALAAGAVVLFPSFYFLFYAFKWNILRLPKSKHSSRASLLQTT